MKNRFSQRERVLRSYTIETWYNNRKVSPPTAVIPEAVHYSTDYTIAISVHNGNGCRTQHLVYDDAMPLSIVLKPKNSLRLALYLNNCTTFEQGKFFYWIGDNEDHTDLRIWQGDKLSLVKEIKNDTSLPLAITFCGIVLSKVQFIPGAREQEQYNIVAISQTDVHFID